MWITKFQKTPKMGHTLKSLETFHLRILSYNRRLEIINQYRIRINVRVIFIQNLVPSNLFLFGCFKRKHRIVKADIIVLNSC